jgi:hypothetical protein
MEKIKELRQEEAKEKENNGHGNGGEGDEDDGGEKYDPSNPGKGKGRV